MDVMVIDLKGYHKGIVIGFYYPRRLITSEGDGLGG